MCAQGRLRSACASAKCDESRCCRIEDALGHWLLAECPVKTDETARMHRLICVSLGAQAILKEMLCPGLVMWDTRAKVSTCTL